MKQKSFRQKYINTCKECSKDFNTDKGLENHWDNEHSELPKYGVIGHWRRA